MNDANRRGQWIWSEQDGPPNTWMCFRRAFELERRPKQALARIAADTKYWLWVNGELVVREGGLKRGPTPSDTYCDEVDLAAHLRKGTNTVGILVWYWGKHGFSHKDSGRGGLFFDSDVLVSDATWKCREHPAFMRSKAAVQRQLALWPVWYDARKAIDGWEQPGYDDADWPNASAKGAPPAKPWGRLVPRPIPFWRDYGIKPYTNAKDLPKQVTVERGRTSTVTAHLPYNCQMAPYLKVKAPAGVIVTIDTVCSRRGKLWAKYVTREGEQAWESPAWLNGQTAFYRFTGTPGTVRILGLGFRETGIDADFAGAFTCDDAALNTLWAKSARTTYLCIRDNYMDCPDRERAQWWGDAVNEILQTFYCLDPKAHASVRKGILEIVHWQRPDGIFYSPVPQGSWGRELPTQMLAGTWVMWQYYQYTADAGTIRTIYPAVKRYVAAWRKRRDRHGLVVPKGEWLWFDWGKEPKDGYRMTNALYLLVLRSAAGMADVAGRPADAKRFNAEAEKHAALCRERLWDGCAYGEDERANALCTLAGLVDVAQPPSAGGTGRPAAQPGAAVPHSSAGVTESLHRTRRCSPYLERYVLEALCRLGRYDLALDRMKARYATMIESDWTTLWENFSRRGTTNHAWSGGPLHVLSAHFAGVRPITPGFETYTVEPNLGPLKRIACTVSTVRGEISVKVQRLRQSGLLLNLVSPKGTQAHVSLPTSGLADAVVEIDGRVVRRGGGSTGRAPGVAVKSMRGGRLRLIAAPGHHEVRLRAGRP